MCSLEIFKNTIERIKGEFKEIMNNTKNHSQSNGKVIIINASQIWTLKLFYIYFIIANYLKEKGYKVYILIDDGILEHIDMIKKNDIFTIDEAKKRNLYAVSEFKKLNCEFFIFYSQFVTNNDIINFNMDLTNKFSRSVYINYSLTRYSNEIENKKYKKTLIKNMQIGHILADEIYKQYKPTAVIINLHMNRYSLASFSNYFGETSTKRVDIDIPNGGYKDGSALQLFSKDETRDNMYKILENLHMDTEKIEVVDKLMEKRISYNITDEISEIYNILKNQRDKNKKIVIVFPNMFEDAMWSGYHTIFDSPLDWFIKTIEYLKNNGYFIIIKAHPAEKRWGSSVSSISYIKDMVDENFLLIQNDSKIPAYSLFKYLDFAVVYNSTLFIETIYAGVPVIVGGNSYIIEGIFNKRITNEEDYFKLFLNIDSVRKKQQEKLTILYKYIYFDFFCREIYVDFLNKELKYPHININKVISLIKEDNKALELIKKLIEDNLHFDFNYFREIFEFTGLKKEIK